MAAPKQVTVGAVPVEPGHVVTHAGVSQGTKQAATQPATAKGASQSAAPTASAATATLADNASYSVASSYTTSPMANQTGRVAVTLTNTGTAAFSGLGAGQALFGLADVLVVGFERLGIQVRGGRRAGERERHGDPSHPYIFARRRLTG